MNKQKLSKMETLKEKAKRASEITLNKIASIVLKVGSRTSEVSAAIYLVKYKDELISEGALTEDDYKLEGANAWDEALYSMQQSKYANMVDDSFELARSLS